MKIRYRKNPNQSAVLNSVRVPIRNVEYKDWSYLSRDADSSTSILNHVTKSNIISKGVHLLAIPPNIYLFRVIIETLEKGVISAQSEQ